MAKTIVSMRNVWKARSMILNGYDVGEVAETTKMSKSTVRLYTKAEREKVKAR